MGSRSWSKGPETLSRFGKCSKSLIQSKKVFNTLNSFKHAVSAFEFSSKKIVFHFSAGKPRSSDNSAEFTDCRVVILYCSKNAHRSQLTSTHWKTSQQSHVLSHDTIICDCVLFDVVCFFWSFPIPFFGRFRAIFFLKLCLFKQAKKSREVSYEAPTYLKRCV